jgi:hypothetical protein
MTGMTSQVELSDVGIGGRTVYTLTNGRREKPNLGYKDIIGGLGPAGTTPFPGTTEAYPRLIFSRQLWRITKRGKTYHIKVRRLSKNATQRLWPITPVQSPQPRM